MKLAIISDSHDHLENLRKAIAIAEKYNAEALIHCGDFCAPFIMDELSKFKGDVHCVFGNIDDRYITSKKAEENNINLHGDLAKLEFNNKNFLATHFPEFAKAFAFTNKYNAVFYGHTHTKNKEIVNNTLLINPGEIMGRKEAPGLAIFDTETEETEFVEIN